MLTLLLGCPVSLVFSYLIAARLHPHSLPVSNHRCFGFTGAADVILCGRAATGTHIGGFHWNSKKLQGLSDFLSLFGMRFQFQGFKRFASKALGQNFRRCFCVLRGAVDTWGINDRKSPCVVRVEPNLIAVPGDYLVSARHGSMLPWIERICNVRIGLLTQYAKESY